MGSGFPRTISHSASTDRFLYLTSTVGNSIFTLHIYTHRYIHRYIKVKHACVIPEYLILTCQFFPSVSAVEEDYRSRHPLSTSR